MAGVEGNERGQQPGERQIKYMSITEFRELGFLQEANRLFFHPLGLSLEAVSAKCPACKGEGKVEQFEGRRVDCVPCGGRGSIETLGGIWDYRDDPEGMTFGEGYGLDPEKAKYVEAERGVHVAHRFELFGFDELPTQHIAVQPLENE